MPSQDHSSRRVQSGGARRIIFTALIIIGALLVGYVLGSAYPQLIHLTPLAPQDASADAIPADQGIEQKDLDGTLGELVGRLVINSTKVDAAIRTVGDTKDGAMAVPNYYAQVGWYTKSAEIGSNGTAVIDGHYSTFIKTAFSELPSIQQGDTITVQKTDGTDVAYVVERTETYHKDAVPMEEILSNTDGLSRLNLITCEGTWNGRDTYSDRFVVYAVMQSAT